MKKSGLLLLLLTLLSCNDNDSLDNEVKKNLNNGQNIIIAERVDGPANVRNKPGGELLLELKDNVLLDVGELENGWYEVFIQAKLEQNEYDEFNKVLIEKSRTIIQRGETIGKLKKDISVRTRTVNGGSKVIMELRGFTQKDNIKPSSIIELAFEKEFKKSGRDQKSLKEFISRFDLGTFEVEVFDFEGFMPFVKFESIVAGGPSPGPRLILFFDNDKLIGFFHSRDIQIGNTLTYKIGRYGSVSFFDDYPKEKQMNFVDYLNVWIDSSN